MQPARHRRVLTATLRVSLVVAFAALAAATSAQERTILRYERLANLSITESRGGANDETSATMLSFEAFGTRFVAKLTRNETLTRNLPPAIRQRLAAEFYSGTLNGEPGSWARFTRAGATLSGALWDGAELYAIEPFEQVASQIVSGPDVDAGESVIYRLADTLSATMDDVVTAASPGAQQPTKTAKLFSELASLQTKLNPVQQLDIGLLADAEFMQANGSNAEAAMLSIANVVDGIFFNQVGVRINVAELRTYGVEPDPFSGTDASALLDQLKDYKLATPELRSTGLVHLLTGRDLDEPAGTPANTKLLGLAHLGDLCDARIAASLTEARNLSNAAMVAAHEIGHNFGAPHDAETGSPCESTHEGFLMSPFINYSQLFSECSLQQIAAELARAPCLHPLPANDLSVQRLSSPTEVIATRAFEVAFAVDFSGVADALDARMTVTYNNLNKVSFTDSAPANCGFWGDPQTTCTFPAFGAGGARREFRAQVVAPQGGPASIDVDVSALNDYVPANNHYRFDFNVVPDAHFELEYKTPVYPAAKPGAFLDLEWLVKNAGSIPATNVSMQLGISDTLEFIAIEAPGGARCSRDASFNWICPVGAIGAGAALPLKVRLRALENPNLQPGTMSGGNVWLLATAAEPIFNYQSAWIGAGVTITPRIADIYVDVTAPASAPVNSKVTLAMRVGNHGPDNAENVGGTLRTWTGRGLTFDSATSNRGSCAKDFSGAIACTFGALASGETIDVTAQATVDADVGDHDIFGNAGTPFSYDTDTTNNESRSLFSSVAAATAPPTPAPPAPTPPSVTPTPITPAPESSGGGGGGAGLDLMLLLSLAGAARVARRLKNDD